MAESKHRRRQARQGASVAYSMPLKTIAVAAIVGVGFFSILIFALVR